MSCKRCPHHVHHGQLSQDKKSIVFKELCGLRLKQIQDPEQLAKKNKGRGRPSTEITKRKPLPEGATLDCLHFPFADMFDYMGCGVYHETFATTGIKNGVIPTKDFQYSEGFTNFTVTDMELL